MLVHGKAMRTIWAEEDCVCIIDQTCLPHSFEIRRLHGVLAVCQAISTMLVRGAGLIGVTAGYGMWQAALEGRTSTQSLELFDKHMQTAGAQLLATRPTAINLARAVHLQHEALSKATSIEEKCACAKAMAETLADEDAAFCKQIGEHGKHLIEAIAQKKQAKQGNPVNILTHCNAGWLAFVDYGSALAPVYAAHNAGIPVHVFVDETRPRQQGARLTAWELAEHGVPHTLIADGAAGYCMRCGKVDIVFVGADCVTASGDVANKLGTYHVALAAKDNNIPMYVALPSSTLSLSMDDGLCDIPIEERHEDELRYVSGMTESGGLLQVVQGAQGGQVVQVARVLVCPESTRAYNPAFDITPARLITGLVTERGLCPATRAGIEALFGTQI